MAAQGLFLGGRFLGFGPDRHRPDGDNPAFEFVSAGGRAELRRRVRQLCPALPGVYGMLNRRGALVYVGKAKVLRKRLLSYFRKGDRDEKAGRIIARTQTIVWEPGPSEFAALVRELELIRRWRPNYNIQGMPGNDRYIYIALGRKPAPFAFTTRDPNGTEVAVFGPLKGAVMANEAARRINDLFRLRDCAQTQTMHFAEQRELFPVLHAAGCLRYELGTCLGPCAAYTTRANYGKHVRAARAFLDGSDVAPLERLQKEMQAASDQLLFEKAAALRDKLTPLQWVRERLNWLSRARDHHSFIYPLRGADGETLWYIIHRGRICRAVAAPNDADTRRAAAEAIAAVYDRKNLAAAPLDEVDHILLVARWFRKFGSERAATLSPERAMGMCLPPKPLAALHSPV